MRARVVAGWISEEDLPVREVEEEVVEDAPAGELDISEMDLEALEAEAEALGLDFNEPLAEQEEE